MPEEFLPYIAIVEDLLRPLIEATEDFDIAEDLLQELGYAPPSQVLAFQELRSVANAVSSVIDSVRAAIDADDQDEVLQQIIQLLPEVGRAVQAINSFEAKIQNNFAGSPFLVLTDILTAIPGKLTDYLIVKYLEDYHPTVFAALLVGGVVDLEDIEDAPTPFHVPYRKRTVNWNGLPTLLSDPLGSLKANLYDGDELLYDRLLYLLYQMGLGLGLFPIFGVPKPAMLTTFNEGADLSALDESEEISTLYFPVIQDPSVGVGFDVYPLADPVTQKYTGLALAVRAGAQLEIPLTENYHLKIKANAEVRDGLGLRIQRDGKISFVSSLFTSPSELAAATTFGVRISIGPTEIGPARKLLSLGAPGGTRFEIGSGSLSFGIEKFDALNLFVEADLKDGLLSLKAGESDGFISKLLPAEGITGTFNLGIGVSNRAGLYFKGTSGLYIRLPLHQALGPINIEYLGIGFGFENEQLPLTLTTGLNALLGPLTAVVEEIGVQAVFTFKPDRSGNLGPLNVTFGFKPPKGVGLSIDAGPISGGGYLFFDFDREEYAGVLQLDISGFVTITAIGMITTRMPDGSKGFSLLIIMTVEFNPGIQLGFGFTFIGIGGLLGLNRTVMLEVLAQGIRNGTLNNIMFPQGDIIANAPRIISDLRAIFPPEEGTFLVGPMVKLGWGSPTLISIAVGVIIEIPGNFAIVGVFKVALPTADAPLIIIQVAFIGAVEFDKKRLWFFASMFESRVLFITLEGEFGLLVAWGDDANFVVSVGGFHPRFNPPPLPFPSPRRIALNLSNNPAYSVRIEGYFAVTSNTVQFGARAELQFGLDGFGIQGHIAFDALFQFSPFYFIIEISASVSLRVFGFDCFSIRLEFSLEGPTPYRARGSGYISILFWEFSADFDVTWGESQDTSLPPIEVMPLLKAEFEKIENWKAELPAGSNLLVSLRPLNAATDLLVLHPVGVLRISQRAIPLDLTLDKIGSQNTTGAKKFSVSVNTVNLGLKGKVDEQFAIAQFQNMSDAEKLSRPSYQPNPGGVDVSVSGNQLKTSGTVKRIVRYEITILDTNYKRFVLKFFKFVDALFYHFFLGSAVTKSVLSQNYKQQRKPYAEAVEVLAESHVVAFNSNNVAISDQAVFASEAQAREYMNIQVAADPNLGEQLHVIPQFEAFSAS